MLTTINYAQTHQLPISFIDMNAQELFNRMLKTMSFSEKIRLMFSGFGGFFVSKKHIEKELSKIQENFDKYIEEIGKKFPTIKRVLIDERNMHMARQLVDANEKYEQVIAVVGDGHIPGLSEMLNKKEIKFESIRLNQLRNQKIEVNDTSTASFTIRHK